MPFLLPLPQDSTLTIWESDGFEGWEDLETSALEGLPATPEGGLSAATALWFRHVPRELEDPATAAVQAFGDVLTADLLGSYRQEEQGDAAPESAPLSGRTVVQLTRLCAGPPSLEALEEGWDLPDETPAADAESDGATNGIELSNWLTREFDRGMTHLNMQLVALASVGPDASFGPISRVALPPFVLQLLSRLGDERTAPTLSVFALHQYPGTVLGDVVSPAAFEHAARLVAREHSDGHPYFTTAESLVEARRALREGRHSQAVLEAGLVAELLITTTLRQAGEALGRTPDEIRAALQAPFIQRARDGLPRLIRMDGDVDDKSTALGHWKQCAYELRNAVVHEAYRPTAHEAAHALLVTQRLVEAVAIALRRRPETHGIADYLWPAGDV